MRRSSAGAPVCYVIANEAKASSSPIARVRPRRWIWTEGLQRRTAWPAPSRRHRLINTYNFYDPAAPFGGYKFSGFAEIWERALQNYTETKTVWVGL